MRKIILKALPVIFFITALSLLGVYIIAPFFEKKEDLNPKVAEEQEIKNESEQENDTI